MNNLEDTYKLSLSLTGKIRSYMMGCNKTELVFIRPILNSAEAIGLSLRQSIDTASSPCGAGPHIFPLDHSGERPGGVTSCPGGDGQQPDHHHDQRGPSHD